MHAFTRGRVLEAAGAITISVLCLGAIGLTPGGAGAGPSNAVPATRPAVASSAFSTGTYNLVVNGDASGTITFNSNNTWTLSSFPNYGSWQVVGKVISLGDVGSYVCCSTHGDPDGSVWSATLHGHDIGTARKPGLATYGANGTFSWYATP